MNYLPLKAKKSLRTLGLFMVTLFAVTAFTSCEPDDDDFYYYDSPEGDWQQLIPSIDGYASYSFYGNKTGVYYVNDIYGEDYYDFIWWADNISLTIDYGNGEIQYYTYRIQGDRLYLTPDNGDVPLILGYIY